MVNNRVIFLLAILSGATLISCAPEIDFIESEPAALKETEAIVASSWTESASDSLSRKALEVTEGGWCLLTDPSSADEAGNASVFFACEWRGDSLIRIQDGSLVAIERNSVMHLTGGESVLTEAFLTQETDSRMTGLLCRSWTPERTYIILCVGESRRVGESFRGCDLGEILDAVVSYGGDLGQIEKMGYGSLMKSAREIHTAYRERAESMRVTSLTFTRRGTFIVAFDSARPYVGHWEWLDMESGVFACDFLVTMAGEAPARVSTTGQIRFNSEGESDITIDASFTDNNRPYKATVDFICREAIAGAGEARGEKAAANASAKGLPDTVAAKPRSRRKGLFSFIGLR